MTRALRVAALLIVMFVAGCSTLRVEPAEAILGRWSSEVGGYPVTLVYAESTVTVDGSDPVPYLLDGNELRFTGGGSQVRLLSFPSRLEMVQTDPMTGTEYVFTRVD